jgi:hypothetical protein
VGAWGERADPAAAGPQGPHSIARGKTLHSYVSLDYGNTGTTTLKALLLRQQSRKQANPENDVSTDPRMNAHCWCTQSYILSPLVVIAHQQWVLIR